MAQEILHNHKPPEDLIFHPRCPRCKIEQAAPGFLELLEEVSNSFVLRGTNIKERIDAAILKATKD